MTKLIWMTDPHFQNQGTIAGLNPRARLEAALTHANTHHGDAAGIVLSGDLVGDDIDGDYRAMAAHLARSALRVYPMMGNNDDRAGMRSHLDLPPGTMPDFVQYQLDLPGAVILCLDTHVVGSHAGALCAARLDWLAARLADAGDTPVTVFMHHPPLALGLPMQDEIMLQDADPFLDIAARAGNLRQLCIGHVHRPTTGSIRGIPFATLGALSFQAPPPRPDWTWDSFVPPKEAPQYGVIHLGADSTVVQYTQFCPYETGIED